MIGDFISFFTQRLRLSKPWKYKVPLLISFPYFLVLNGKLSHDAFLYSIAASLVTTIGFLGIAYLSNDLSDRKSDAAAGKSNATLGLKNWKIALSYLLFIGLAFLPWQYLPFDKMSAILVAIELALFLSYAFPPFRLKEKGVWGLVADALYAHVVPTVLASWTFYLIIGKSYTLFFEFLLAASLWQFISGFRNILSHQIKDYENDLASDTKTWVTVNGVGKATKMLKRVIVPLELLSFLGFLGFLQLKIIYVFPVYLFYTVYAYFVFKRKLKDQNETELKRFTNQFLDNFYVRWLPLLTLSGLIFIITEVRAVLLLHLICFVEPLQNFILKKINFIKDKFLHSKLKKFLYDYKGHYKGMLIHFSILLGYTLLFCGIYFFLQTQITDTETFFHQQRTVSRLLVVLMLLHLLFFFMLRKKSSVELINSFVFEKGSAYNLAIFRILFFFILIRSIHAIVLESFVSWTYLPETARVGLPFIGWLIEIIPINPQLYTIAAYIALGLAYCGLWGFQAKWTIKIYALFALYLWGVPCFFGKLNHHHIMVWIPIIFAFAPSSDVLSIDALIKKKRKVSTPPQWHIKYSLPLKIIWLLLAIIYCFAGFRKLWDVGLYWALSDNLMNQIRLEWIENYDVVTSFRIDHYPLLLKAMGLLTILFEITYPIFLLKPATRIINFIGSWSLHLSAGYFMNIDFSYLRRVHYSLFNWEKLYEKLRAKPLSLAQKTKDNPCHYKKLKKYPVVIVGVILIGFNFIFSVFGISSWPFSDYPSYTGIVKNSVHLIEMKAINAEGNTINVKQIGKEEGFRWENIRPFEERIAKAYLSGDTTNLSQKLNDYWQLWETKVPGLQEAVKIEMSLVTTSLVPEERDVVLKDQYLGTVITNVEKE